VRGEFILARLAIWLSLPAAVLARMQVNLASYPQTVRQINFQRLNDAFNNAQTEIRNTLGIPQLEREFEAIINKNGSSRITNNSSEESKLNYRIFVNILYAVVIGETIFEYANELLSVSISTLALVVVYTGIISSWLFWNNAIDKYPHVSFKRFITDIIVLLSYMIMMKNHTNLDSVFIGFIFLYSLFVIWDFLTRLEHGAKSSRLKTSVINLIVISLVYATREIIFHYFEHIIRTHVNVVMLLILLIVIIVTQYMDIKRISKNS
jgi:hypothetical protein